MKRGETLEVVAKIIAQSPAGVLAAGRGSDRALRGLAVAGRVREAYLIAALADDVRRAKIKRVK
jgi:hypothetical protein